MKDLKISDIYPLSPMQAGFLFHDLYASASDAYLIQKVFYLKNVKTDLLEAAWVEVINKHPILRSGFSFKELQEPVQYVLEAVTIPFFKDDWSHLKRDEQEERLTSFLHQDRERKFDLSVPPLLRIGLIKLNQDTCVMIWTFHHLILDGWSAAQVLAEAFQIYESLKKGEYIGAKVRRPYRDYIAWLVHQDKDKAREFWRNYFNGLDARGYLSFKDQIEEDTKQSYLSQTYFLSLHETQQLQKYSKSHGVTTYTLLLGILGIILQRYTNQKDAVIGMTTSGRSIGLDGINEMVGLFINTVPLRIDSHNNNIHRYFKLLQHNIQKVLEFGYISLAEIQNVTELKRDLFDILFVYENYPIDDVVYKNSSLKIDKHFGIEKTEYPLSVIGELTNNILSISFTYQTAHFNRYFIEQLYQAIKRVVDLIITQKAIDIRKIDLWPNNSVPCGLYEKKSIKVDCDVAKCIHHIFEEQVENKFIHDALVFNKKSITYGDLNARANKLARYLHKLGVTADAVVAISVEKSFEMIIGILGILKAGAAYLPLDPNYPYKRLKYMLDSTSSKLVLVQDKFKDKFLNSSVNVISFDKDWSQIETESAANLNKVINHANLAYVIFTSGSTGSPKGVQISHAALINYVNAISNLCLSNVERIALHSVFSADLGNTAIFASLLFGKIAYFIQDEVIMDPDKFREFITDNEIDFLKITPNHYIALTQDRLILPKKCLMFGGERVPESLIRNIANENNHLLIINHYGPTEATIGSSINICKGNDIYKSNSVPIGYPILNVQLYILDDYLNLLPVGVEGEIFIGGKGLARGYVNSSALTAEKFIANPFGNGERLYRTGDRGRYLIEGRVEFLGRADNQIKVRGYRIEAGEVEAAINELKMVKKSLVFGTNLKNEHRLLAYIVIDQNWISKAQNLKSQSMNSVTIFMGGDIDKLCEEIRDFIAIILPEHMLPNRFIVLNDLPLNPNGKIDVKVLQALPIDVALDNDENTLPNNIIEDHLKKIWQEVLNLNGIGVNDNFFRIGGHSLLAIKIISRVRNVFDIDLPLKKIFEFPTIRRLSAVLEEGGFRSCIPPLVRQVKLEHMPLSFAQHRIWVIDRLLPQKALYNIPSALRLVGELNYALLEKAINYLFKRHESLRTQFLESENLIAYQKIRPNVRYDLQKNTFLVINNEFDVFIKNESETPFDLTNDILIRIKLLKVEDNYHILTVVMHHIISDGWSVPIFFDELAYLYKAFRHNEAIQLSELPINYTDYAVWQRTWLKDELLKKQLEYWKEHLYGSPEYLEVPTDYQRPSDMSYSGGRYDFYVPHEIYKELLVMAERQSVTMFMLTFAVICSLLHKYSGQNDIVIGAPISNRPYKETEGLIGFFINTLALRTHFNEDTTFLDVLSQVKEAILKGHENQDLPFEYLVEQMNVTRSLNRNPIFQVMVTMTKGGRKEDYLKQANIEAEQIYTTYAISKFDLTFFAFEHDNNLRLSIEYSTELFKYETIERMSGHFNNLLVNLINNNWLKEIRSLNMLSSQERSKQLLNWNQTEVEYPKHKSIHEIFEKQVRAKPEATAVIFKDQRVTYKELNSRANQLAHHLRKLGVTADTVVGIGVERSIEMIVGILGILKAGGAYLPLDPSYPVARLRYMLEDSKAKLLLIQESLRERFAGVGVKTISFEEEAEKIAMEVQDDLEVPINPLNLAYIIYTSGSTGQPKGVQIAHKSLVNRLSWMQEKYKLESQDRVLHKTPFSFDVAVWELFWPILEGSQLVIAPPEVHKDPIEISRLIEKYGITVIHFVPSMLNLFLNFNNNNESLKNIRVLVASGEPLTVKQHEQTEYKVNNLYGPTEATVDVSYYASDKQLNSLTVPIGCPISNTQLYVLDRGLNLLLIGVTGEIYIGGVGLARGYINRPDLTAERFIANPFNVGDRLYKTGDLGRFLPDGNIEFLGRIDNQVKIRGFRIELGEIEKVIGEYVREVVVLVKSDENDSKQLVAYIVPKEVEGFSSSFCFKSETGEEISVYEGEEAVALVERIRNELASKLPEYMVPSYFVVLSKLPLNLSGKTDSKILQRLDHGRILLEDEYVAPRNEIEGKLCKIWEEVLKVERVGINDNFFRIGGDSIIAIQMISKAKKEGLNFLVKDIFNFPVISKLSGLVDTEILESFEYTPIPFELCGNDKDIVIDRINAPDNLENAYPLSPMQEGLLFSSLYFQDNIYLIQDVIKINSSIDIEAFKKAWIFVVNAHESLRTGFLSDTSRPIQYVLKEVDDLLIIQHADEPLNDILRNDRNTKFNLDQPPLMRIHLIKHTESSYTIVWCFHHIILDGWSSGIVINDFMKTYSVYLKHQKPIIKEHRKYVEYISYINYKSMESAEKFWRNYLLDIEATRSFAEISSSNRHAQETYRISKLETVELTDFLSGVGATMSTLLIAAIGLVFQKRVKNESLAIGITTSGRANTFSGIENMTGVFINTLPVVIRNNYKNVKELLANLQKDILNIEEFSFAPLSKIQKWSGLGDNLFKVIFVYKNFPIDESSFTDLDLKVESAIGIEQIEYPIGIIAFRRESQIHLKINYRESFFKKQDIDEIFDDILKVIRAILKGNVLQGLTKENKILCNPINYTTKLFDKDKCIYEIVEGVAKDTPDAIAVEFGQEKITYKKLIQLVDFVANYLRNRGIRRESIVAIKMDRSIDYIATILGVLKVGAAYLALDVDTPPERLEYMLNDSGAEVLLEAIPIDAISPQQILSGSSVTLDNIACIVYTSGSTGAPKGTAITHKNILNLIYASDLKHKRVICCTNFCFDVSTYEIFLPLLNGGTIILLDRKLLLAADNFGNVVRKLDANIMTLPLAMFSSLVLDGCDFSSIEYLLVGGDKFSQTYLSKLMPKKQPSHLINSYGLTENTVISCNYEVPFNGADSSIIPIGRPLPNTKVYILGSDMLPVPRGDIGEIYIGGEGIARSYLHESSLTAERFIANPFGNGDRVYKTGDLGRVLESGDIEYVGRQDRQVKIRGYRIELSEVEKVLNSCRNVKSSIVLQKEFADGVKRLIAFIVADQFLISDIRSEISRFLPDYMIPAFFIKIDTIPLNSNGKIDVDKLLMINLENELTIDRYVPPRNKIENMLCNIFEKVLGINNVGIDDNFFEIGGDSIIAIQVIAKAKMHNIPIGIKDIFDHKTIRNITENIKRDNEISPEIEVRDGWFPLSPLQDYLIKSSNKSSGQSPLYLLLKSNKKIKKTSLSKSLQIILEYYNIFKISLGCNNGAWMQKYNSSLDAITVNEVFIGEQSINDFLENKKFQYDVQSSPLIDIQIFGKDNVSGFEYMLVLFNPIIIDLASCYHFISLIDKAYQANLESYPISLPEKRHSLGQFIDAIALITREEFDQEMIINGLKYNEVCAESYKNATVYLDANSTSVLINNNNFKVEEILLSVMAKLLQRNKFTFYFYKDLRNEINNLNLSDALGNYSHIFRVDIELPEFNNVFKNIINIQKQLRVVFDSKSLVLNSTVKIPPGSIIFNFNEIMDNAKLSQFNMLDDNYINLFNCFGSSLNISCSVIEDRLKINISYLNNDKLLNLPNNLIDEFINILLGTKNLIKDDIDNYIYNDINVSDVTELIKVENSKEKLFLLPPISGHSFPYLILSDNEILRKNNISLYSIGDPDFGVAFDECSDLVGLSGKFVELAKNKIDHGDLISLAGWCFGGYVSLEIARILLSQGFHIKTVIVIDSPDPSLMQRIEGFSDEEIRKVHKFLDENGVKRGTWSERKIIDNLKKNTYIASRYVPDKLSCRIDLILTQGNRNQVTENFWNSISNNVVVHEIDLIHSEIFDEKNIEFISNLLFELTKS